MLEQFLRAWGATQGTLKEAIKARGEEIFNYEELLKTTLSHCFPKPDGYASLPEPDAERIHCVDDGDYQGTLVFVVGAAGYQPSDYFVFKVGYGSCSGCDTMQSIYCDHGSIAGGPNDTQVDLLWTEALHMMQGAINV